VLGGTLGVDGVECAVQIWTLTEVGGVEHTEIWGVGGEVEGALLTWGVDGTDKK
jgi:hypothetical protein